MIFWSVMGVMKKKTKFIVKKKFNKDTKKRICGYFFIIKKEFNKDSKKEICGYF